MAIDEELPTPTGMSPRRRNLVIVLAALAVLGLVVAGIARLVTRATPQAAPTVTVAPPTPTHSSARPSQTGSGPVELSKPPAVLPVLHSLTRGAIESARAECPRLAPTCTTTGEVPAAVTDALRAAFTQAKRLVAVSDIAYATNSGPHLAYRRLSAQAGRLTLTVEARATASGDGTGFQRSTDTGGHTVRYETVVHGLTIEVQGSAPTSRYIDLDHLERLAVDPRLLAIG